MSMGHRHHHSLVVSSLAWVAAVELLYLTAGFLHDRINWPYRNLDLRLQDYVTRRARLAPADPRLVFLADDAPSHTLDQLWDDEIAASPALKLMKRRIWSREVPALVIERLASAGAKVVAFDYMYQGEYDGDAALRAALEKWRNVAVVGAQFEETRMGGAFNPPPPGILPATEEPDDRVGYVNFWPDEDGVVRRARFSVTREEVGRIAASESSKIYESLAARMVRKAGFGELIPSDRQTHLFRYAFKGEMLQEDQKPPSLHGIFVPTIWANNYSNGAFFKDKLVLIGPEGRYNKDLGGSPFGVVAGPEFHLNAANALLQRQLLRDSPLWLDLLLIAVAGVAAWLCGRFVPQPALRVVIVLALAVSAFWGAVLLYNSDWVVPIFSPLLTLFGIIFSFSITEQVLERLERARLRKTFERYVSRDVVKELVDNPSGWLNTLGGARKNITVLFSDVRGFTTITESGDAHALVQQLNEYFNEMVNIVFEHHGTLDKFIGDAVMALWGGIVSEGEKVDACRAVATAVAMRKALARLNPGWIEREMVEIKFGIGINHGEAIVGNLGAEVKKEVTAIGDAVNTASRLEGMTKEFHVDLLIGEQVAALVRDQFFVRTVALSQPKGKTKPLEIFTVLDRRDGVPEPAWLASYEEGVQLYRRRDFAGAVARFEQTLELLPGDWLATDYLEKSRIFLDAPPSPKWNAVHVMTSK
jgi:adenylate cyclase